MSIYSANLYAKKIPKVDITSEEGMQLLKSQSTMVAVSPGLTEGKVKNLRSIALADLIEYIKGGDSEQYYKLYDKEGTHGQRIDTTIRLDDSRLNYRALLFVYGTKNLSAGTSIKTNRELDILNEISHDEIRISELSSGCITISDLTVNMFDAGEWADYILEVYGIGVGTGFDPTPPPLQ